ncbi:MAG: hypothetical protein FWC34_08975 [Bacteroidetes bacterium]|nr:hypothetical protein [Bacteroidota bacterium]MCL2303452.1 hypothetical protein [Lentimicrobiaceae bacterium]
MNEINIIDFKMNLEQGTFSLILNFYLLISVTLIIFIIYYLIKIINKRKLKYTKIELVKLKLSFNGQEAEYKVKKDLEKIEIAHRIYVELITRKAALRLDEANDIIVEVYNSWYSLFQITREELKNISGEYLSENDDAEDFVKLLTDVLNKGLRPHLTEYQAKFRKWYGEVLLVKENRNLTPQQIQSKYEKYTELIESMRAVNQLLIDYSDSLKQIVKNQNI